MKEINRADDKKITARSIPEVEPITCGHRACQGCGEILAMRQVMKALGTDVIVVSATGCMEVVTTPYPETAWKVPWIHVLFENAAAVGSGVEAARKAVSRKRHIENNKTKIVIVGGDGATSDIGLQALSGALERGHDFVYVCFDNEAYMNTGIQRSSTTPMGCWTTTTPTGLVSAGKTSDKKDMVEIVASHRIPYVATASPAYHIDLMNKVRTAAAITGPAFIHVLAPCPTGWRMPTRYAVTAAKLAVQTRIYPLYEVIDGRHRLSRTSKNPKPVTEYLNLQGRFKHLSEAQVQTIQDQVDKRYAELEWRSAMPDFQ
jgi:pyruvate ferredoxin oxidoreductase beta subunit